MSSESQEILENFTNFMKPNSRGVEIISYGVASLGFLTALYRIRPFSKFCKPYDVPKFFLKKKIELEGVVRHIEPAEQPYIMVDHKPLVALPRFGKPKYLPLKVAGIKVTGNGISWLQTIVKGQNIKFLPITRHRDALDCIIMIPQKNNEFLPVAQELVKLGFGVIQDKPLTELRNNEDIKVYLKSLHSAQKLAERKRNGLWQFEYSPTLIWKMKNFLDNKLKSILPIFLSRFINI